MKAVIATIVLVCILTDVSGVPCQTSADCGANECCVSENRPIGRKRQFGMSCQPLGQDGDGCLVRYTSFDPTLSYYSCPCADGLVCRGSGLIDIPLGETGTCA